jgi:hypothetical protein
MNMKEKKIYVVMDCWKEGDHEGYVYPFSSLEQAQAKLNEIVADFEDEHDSSEWEKEISDDKAVCKVSYQHHEEDWFDHIELFEMCVPEDTQTVFSILVDNSVENDFHINLFAQEEAASKFLDYYAAEYIDENGLNWDTAVTADSKDENLKHVNSSILTGKFRAYGDGDKFVDLRYKDLLIDLVMSSESVVSARA